MKNIFPAALLMLYIVSCKESVDDVFMQVPDPEPPLVTLEGVAVMLASLPMNPAIWRRCMKLYRHLHSTAMMRNIPCETSSPSQVKGWGIRT